MDPISPKVTLPRGSGIGSRMELLAKQHDPVAHFIASKMIVDGHSAFISDGVTAFGVGLHLLWRKCNALIHTNNLALAIEGCFHPIPEGRPALVVPKGHIDGTLAMIYGRSANLFAKRSATELEWTVLSVASMFGRLGPAGKEHTSIQIKRAAVENPRRVIWIADHLKLSQEISSQPLVYANANDWQAAARGDNIWVITNRFPNLPLTLRTTDFETLQPATLRQMLQSDEGRYAYNAFWLRRLLDNRFVEV